jgi:hypothetical protein
MGVARLLVIMVVYTVAFPHTHGPRNWQGPWPAVIHIPTSMAKSDLVIHSRSIHGNTTSFVLESSKTLAGSCEE